MPSTKPVKNAISSASEFKTLCVTVSKSYKIRVSDEAIRHLRLTMNTSVASAALLPEAIDVIISSLANQTSGVTVSTTYARGFFLLVLPTTKNPMTRRSAGPTRSLKERSSTTSASC
ncbi:hypothetical protein Pcac1_g19891 [Phytophthora cactorum]|nr:hypothetical protein Pcac1_g19891 [Phytophthora cactorum]